MLRIDRNIVALSTAMLLLSLGESLWKKFIPAYLQALGAPIRAIGAYGTLQDLLDGLYQYPGGWLSDRLGRRRALFLFVGIATCGYAIYAIAQTWMWALVALVFAVGWSSMASPSLFAVVADALPKHRRAMGFTVQSILRRVPIVFAPILGGYVIARAGILSGMQALFAVTIALAVLAVAAIHHIELPPFEIHHASIRGVWAKMPRPLRLLLLSDVFVRVAEGMVDVFLVIYATRVIGVSAPQFGVLIGVQTITAIAIYFPAARCADRFGRKPFVIATFLAFSLFPIAVMSATSFATAVLAFIVGGLREIGEPPRKALIVDLAEPLMRGRTVGLYYLVRSIAIAPAAFIGGVLWERSPSLPFIVACCAGLVGTVVFALTVDEEHAG